MLAIWCAWVSPSLAQTKPKPSNLLIEAVELKKGQRAPFTGQLLSTELALRLGVAAETCALEKELQVAHEKRICKIESGAEKSAHKIRETALRNQIKVYEAALKEAEEQEKFWETPEFIVPVTLAGGIAIGFAIFYGATAAVGELRPQIPAP